MMKMEKKTLLLSVLTLLLALSASAAQTVVWEGTQKFTNWSDVLNVEGYKLKEAKTDDVLLLSITATDGAQLQLSWGNNWTCFERMEHKDISGNYEMLLTAQDADQLRQGIHIKGVNFTLTAVTLRSNDGEYTTHAEDLFAWKDMLTSGATQGGKCTIRLKPYGGAGWYWPETVNLSNHSGIVVKLLQPATEPMTVQLLYGNKSVKSQAISKNATQCELSLTAAHKKVYSLNIISEKAQTVSIGSVNLIDKQGNAVTTEVKGLRPDYYQVIGTEYYNTAGIRLAYPQPGINIVKMNLEGGRNIVRKEWK